MGRYLPIPFNKLYLACSNGKIYNKHGKEIGGKHSTGYRIVFIKNRETNKFKSYYVHRLIWITFNGEMPKGYEIDHINCIRDDNRLENLRLVTHKKNCNNPKTLENYSMANKGTHHTEETKKKMSEAHKGCKHAEETKQKMSEARKIPVYQYTLDGKLLRVWSSAKDAAEELGINGSNISSCCKGRHKSAGGYIWSYTQL